MEGVLRSRSGWSGVRSVSCWVRFGEVKGCFEVGLISC